MKELIEPTQIRSELLRLEKYARIKPDGYKESYADTVDRVVWNHQRWLWERALSRSLNHAEKNELALLEKSMLKREQSCAGRTLWLGGTDLSKEIELTQFNCAFLNLNNVRDMVDFYWALLNGSGVSAKMGLGLAGFEKPLMLEVVESRRKSKGGAEKNVETWDPDTKTWRIVFGDSAEGWAKGIGKLVAHLFPAEKLILDFSEIRPSGIRLSRYGWISSGDSQLVTACRAIVDILNKRAGNFLLKMDILDIANWLGTTLSSRRSAEMMVMDSSDNEIEQFIYAKRDASLYHRHQSNNSVLFNSTPSFSKIQHYVNMALLNGEPGNLNGRLAQKKAPWFEGTNPCGEAMLMSQSMCNLHEVNLGAFVNDFNGLKKAVWLGARANYRQTLVNLNDGMLQENWDRNNRFLRLCGVGLTGIQANPLSTTQYAELRMICHESMGMLAKDLGTLPSKAVTLVKPSGTLSKAIFGGVSEGIHYHTSKYMFNNINIRTDSPMINSLKRAGFLLKPHPSNDQSYLLKLPIDNSSRYRKMPGAIEQLEGYKSVLNSWCDHNASITVTVAKEEVRDVVNWVFHNWDSYLGVTFFPREKSNVDYGYLPQEEVDKETFNDYVKTLSPVSSESLHGIGIEGADSDCEGGHCPVN